MRPLHAFLWGSFGSVLPQINAFRVTVLTIQPNPPFPITLLNLGRAVALAIVGSIICIAWNPEHPLKAIYIGIAWPFMLSALAHV